MMMLDALSPDVPMPALLTDESPADSPRPATLRSPQRFASQCTAFPGATSRASSLPTPAFTIAYAHASSVQFRLMCCVLSSANCKPQTARYPSFPSRLGSFSVVLGSLFVGFESSVVHSTP